MIVRVRRFWVIAMLLIGALAPAAPCRPAGAQQREAGRRETSRREDKRYDEVVNAFIAYDIGQLRGAQGQRANQAFRSLQGDAAIPAVIRGVNKAARMRQSCPIIVVARKLENMLEATKDDDMLRYAIDHLDNSGQGVVYGSYVDRLRELAERKLYGEGRRQRKLQGGTVSQLLRAQKPVEQWTYEDLQEAIHQEKGSQLVRVLEELEKRKGAQHTNTLAQAIAVVPDDAREIARALLAQRLVRMTDGTLRAKLEDPNVEVRAAAVRAVGYKRAPLYREVAAAMRDKPLVAEYARQVLLKLSGEDFGPGPDASVAEWYAASKRWEAWAERQQMEEEESR